ncbi:amino acid adenylation domain-containing protein [Rugamonas sp. CCM 8940]|nr:amino acid adenylation domain-containing protein [Rugamonas sp. CCM 8940]
MPTAEALPPISAVPRDAPLPLSWAQQRLWLLSRIDSTAGAAYHMAAGLRLSGVLDVAALQATLDRLVARHESLRTTFAEGADGMPLQRIAAPASFALERGELSQLGGAEQAAAVQRAAVDEYCRPFDLASGPLVRGRLLRLGEREHVLLVTQHHIVSDGWSMGILVREVSALYAAFSQGRPDPLAPLAIQYADYAHWQRATVRGERLREQLEHWRSHLEGAPALLTLPTDRPRPAQQSYAGGKVRCALAPELAQQVRALAQRHGCTPFVVMLAGWSALLARLSGQDDVVVGAAVANRQRPESEALIGFFVNALPLRVRFDGDVTVAQLLAQLRQTTLAAYRRQDVPFEQVVEALKPPRHMGHSPIFQSMITHNDTPRQGELTLAGLRLAPLEAPQVMAKFDLSLSFSDGGRDIACEIEYAGDLFEEATVLRFGGYFKRLLAAMADGEAQPVRALALLDDAERRAQLDDCNRTAHDFGPTGLAHQVFEARAAATPDAPALAYEGERISYAQLNARANVLAHRLLALGVLPDDRIAICLQRSPDMVVALWGILKAGCAYVPLDAAQPPQRLAQLLADCAPVAVVTLQAQEDLLPASSLLRVIVLDGAEYRDAPATAQQHNPSVAGLTRRHLAYLMYTSGSSGVPKGVMIEHAALNNYLHWALQAYAAAAGRPLDALVLSPLAFDATITGLYLPLLSGGCATLLRDGAELDQLEAGLRRDGRWDLVKITPAHLALLAQRLRPDTLRAQVGLFVVGGETLASATVALWRRLSPATRIVNEYGPTETVVGCIVHEAREADEAQPEVPIGLPIANTRIYLLDAQRQPVPPGVEGEIYIGGAGVARGYHRREELNAQRFLTDPFHAGGRMYRSGDLARRRADGVIDYRGRNDFQVKLRGYRIEPGEVEARLLACQGVCEAVVVVREDRPGDRRLVAYLVAREGGAPDAGALRRLLAAQLPEYMVPAAFVALAALPLTPNGKLDRRALPAPEDDALASRAYAEPVGATETALAQLWQELLGAQRVGRHDNFFELGGHSLLLVQLVTRIRQALGVELQLSELFAHPTLAQMAAVVVAGGVDSGPAIVAVPRIAPLPLSMAQQRLWFLDRLDSAASAAYHIAVGLRLSGVLDVAALQATLDRLVARHESLRTTFAEGADGMPRQCIAAPASFALERGELSQLGGAEQAAAVQRAAVDEYCRPFDLAAGPLVRGRLLRLGEREHVLLVTQHHIVSDGWSMGILVREVSALYAAFSQGRPDPLAPLAIQYADYAHWQRATVQGERLREQLEHWRSHLEGAPALLTLPTDRPRPAQQSYAGGKVRCALAPELAQQVRALAQRHGCTPFVVMLAGWSALLARLSGQDDVVVGAAVANRQRPESEALIGFFVNALPLRVRFDGDVTVAQLLAQLRQTTLAAYRRQDVPFEQVVEALKPPRHMGHSPIFQSMITHNDTPRQGELTLAGLRLAPLEAPQVMAKFDLSLSFSDGGRDIACEIEYAGDLFEEATVLRFGGYFKRLLAAMAGDEARPVGALALLDDAERRAQLDDCNRTARDFGPTGLAHQVFEARAAATPDAPALAYEGERISYAQLNARANVLAHRLLALGVRPDDRIAICLERSPDMVVALWGILKAGCAYVPLDAAQPPQRLAQLLADCAPVAVVTLLAQEDLLPASSLLRVIVLDGAEYRGAPAAAQQHNPSVAGLTRRHLAYLMYTSGSSGVPKGVMIEHAALNNYLHWALQAYAAAAGPLDTLVLSPLAFDATITGLYLPLLSGGCATLLRDGAELDQLEAGLRRDGRWDLVKITPAHLALLGQRLRPDTLRAQVGLFVVGGETLAAATVALWRRLSPATRIVNEYGPTETVVGCIVHEARQVDEAQPEVPIGLPIANTRIYLLDAQRQPVPPGVEGEIYIGGAGVARGYHRREELNAQRFLADPFHAGGRMYRSGDMARRRADGVIDYRGRNDFQVKLRGYRIEPGEVEARLLACQGVREAVVVVREDRPGDRRLVAYLVAREGGAPDAGALRRLLAAQLPEYMVPAAFVALAALPLTPNGKLDRRALPAPEDDALASRAYAEPVGATETALAQLWQELLGAQRVGRHDNFFELGGHSLLVVSLISQLRAQGLGADVRTVFEHPVLCDLASAASALPLPAAAPAAPSGVIPPGATVITPAMTALAGLEQDALERICAAVPGGAANIQDIYPLGPLQEGILFHHLLQQQGDAYLQRLVLDFDSRAHLDRFMAAMDDALARHDILRTAIHWEGLARPVQVVLREAPLGVEELPAADGAALEQLMAHCDPQRQRLDLRQAPLLRAHVMADAASGRWLLALLYHHIVCDHVTLDLLIGEIGAILSGRAAQLPALQPYRAFIARTEAAGHEEHAAYFRRQLADVAEPTAPFGVLDVRGDGWQVQEARLRLPTKAALQVREAARRYGVTPAVLFHVAYAQVLGQCSGRDDVVFGTVLSGRLHGGAEMQDTLGMFINTLPLRLRLAGSDAAKAVRACHAALGELLLHEQASLGLAQRCSGIAAPMPLFTALLNYRHTRLHGAAREQGMWAGVRVLAVEERTNYPVTLSVDELEQDFALNAQCVGSANAQRLAGYAATAVAALAEALLEQPSQPVLALPVLPAAERAMLLDDYNATAFPYPDQQPIHARFEACAAARPQACALVHGDRQLSYGELNRRANQVAHRLLAAGVQPGDRVAVCAARGVAVLAALLGVLKSGAAYVPLDPAYPAERLAFMLADSGPVVLVADGTLPAALQEADLPLLRLGADGAPCDGAAAPEHNPAPRQGMHPHSLAYVIYTSGSTGVPKGVMVGHGGVLNLANWQRHYYRLDGDSRVAQLFSYSFDGAVGETMMALLNGAALVLLEPADLAPERLVACINRHGIHVMVLVPSLLRQLDPAALEQPSRFTVVSVGEACPPDLAQAWSAHCRFINGYGPTEYTVYSHVWEANAAGLARHACVPIGVPMHNTRTYLLDERLNPVPPGVAGELYISGAGIARGYLNRAALTAERFVANPFAPDDASAEYRRMYRTGDLARYLEGGDIEYLGRADFQVKIRGFRVELGEIEARLAACDGVREAAVLAREDRPGDQRLVAYVVAAPAAQLSAALLRKALAGQLPEYMLPAAFVLLETLPLTSNGKLDRHALPAPDQDAYGRQAYRAPDGASEVALAGIWQSLLNVAQVGLDDHFFELGGHSLLAIQLAARVHQALGLVLPLAAVFEHPTLAALAGALADCAPAGWSRIEPMPRGVAPQLSWAQQRLWFLDQFDRAASAAYHIPLGLRLRGALDRVALRAALDRIVARHDSLRTRFAEQDGAPVQLIASQAGFALEESDLRGSPAAQREQALRQAGLAVFGAPFDLAAGPLVRGQLLRTADDEHMLLVCQHHIISDGWSVAVLVREFGALYQAYADGGADPLPPLAIQYADYAHWQRNWLQGERRQSQADYWRRQLAGAPALLAVPTDRPRPALQDHGGARLAFELPAPLAASLRALAQRHGATLFMVLLGGWAALLARLSGQDEVVIGTPVANRQRADVEGLIGFFVNTLALRVPCGGDLEVAGLLARVRQVTLAAYQHQDLPFDQVVEALRPIRSMAHGPLFQTMLTMNNTPQAQALRLAGLELEPLEAPAVSVNEDLALSLTDSGAGIGAELVYATALFDHATAQRHAAAYVAVLEGMCADEHQAIAALPLLAEAQRAAVLALAAGPSRAWQHGGGVHGLFEAQAVRTPDAVALQCGDTRLTYAQLNRRANRLAHHLASFALRADDRVAVCLDRAPELLIALLAVLKAGAAYVPLDPAYSVRLADMLADSRPALMLTQTALAGLADAAEVPRLLLDGPANPLLRDDLPEHNPARGVQPSDLAYLIYTSGSTGRPKGVMVEHGAVCNLLLAMQEQLQLAPSDRLLAVTTAGFDIAALEWFLPLACGAQVVLLGREAAQDPDLLLAALERHAVTALQATPATWQMLLRAGWRGSAGLKAVCGGEALPAALAQAVLARCGALWNAYGPTEATIWATLKRCLPTGDGAAPSATVALGRPLSNLQAYVLDSRLQPVPPGCIGEILLGGAGLARGYFERPELDAERFVWADPDGQGMRRLYRSGDLGYWRADGDLAYAGRNDHQIKLRGFRIEPGEIEQRLLGCDGVRQALVVAESGEQARLLAYVVMADGAATPPPTLRAALAALLPDYMIPAAFMALAALPLTANGKIDRKALPPPEAAATAALPYAAPQGELEQLLAQLWREVLDVPRVGRLDDFFELGGHSMLATALLAAVRQRCGVKVALRAFFEDATVAALARALAAARVADDQLDEYDEC